MNGISRLLAQGVEIGVRQLISRAPQLGVSWRLRPATCAESRTRVSTRVILDGDRVPVPALSLIGPVPPRARVMVLLLPAGGTYVLGWYGPGMTQPSQFSRVEETFENLNTASFTPTSPAPSVVFQAPASGNAKIDMFVRADADNTGERFDADVQVRVGSSAGGVVHPPTVVDGALAWYWNPAFPASTNHAGWRYLSGLTPGGSYWAQLQFDTHGVDIDILDQSILYTPLP